MRRHDLKAAREHGIIDALGEAGFKADADKTPHAAIRSRISTGHDRLILAGRHGFG